MIIDISQYTYRELLELRKSLNLKKGRKPKYKTEEERKQAKRQQIKGYYRAKKLSTD